MASNIPTTQTVTRKPFFGTPPGLITGGMALWGLSFALSCLLTVLIIKSAPTQGQDRTATIITAYVGYSVPILTGLGGTAMIIIGAVRWAIYGKACVGAPGLRQPLVMLDSINERLLLSETAKRIAYRHEDVELLHETVRADIEKKDFDAAMVLVNEIGNTYGQKEDAEEYRDKILLARSTEIEAKVDRVLVVLDKTLARHDFDAATKEALKIQRLYSDSPRVRDVHRKVAHAREQYKHDLEREFLQAASVDDVDRAMDLLKVMDRYLTEQEAAPFRETARGVIGKKRENLGVQFKIAIHDREWLRAVAVGEQIIRESPNTRMADEARGMLDLLRERAAGQRAAQARDMGTQARVIDEVTQGVPQS